MLPVVLYNALYVLCSTKVTIIIVCRCTLRLVPQFLVLHTDLYVMLCTLSSIVMYAPLSMLNNGLCIDMLVWCMHGVC